MGGFGKFNKTNADGNVMISASYEDVPEQAVFKGRQHTAVAGETTFFDIEITTEIKMKKGSYHVQNIDDIVEGDYIEFSVIDKNDVLGLFGTYGLTVGVDILELHKFVRTEFIEKVGFDAGQNSFGDDVYGAFPVNSGLFFRIAYNSVAESGANDIKFLSRILWYE